MSNVYFVKTRTMLIPHYYDAYDDYFALAELSGYETIYIDALDPQSDNVYIITPRNGEWNHGWQNPRARIIHHDLEWRLENKGYAWEKAEYDEIPGVSEVWASDKWYASIVGARYVPLGSHALLVGKETPDSAHYDTAVMACQSQDGGRQHIFDSLLTGGLTIAPNAWNPARDSILKSTAVMLHTHQWRDVKTIAPLRYAIAAAYAMPLISEPVEDRDIFDNIVLYCEAGLLPEYTRNLIRRHEPLLTEHGQALHELLCYEYSFRKNVEAAL